MPQRFFVGDLRVSSPAFGERERIPSRYTTEGEDVSPPLLWTGAPAGTRSFAVVMHDPDAPLVDGFTHWVLYGIPADVNTLEEGSAVYVAGLNQLGTPLYIGPAPPPGHNIHHYFFWVYALDVAPDLEPGLTRRELFARIEDRILEQARLVGLYSR